MCRKSTSILSRFCCCVDVVYIRARRPDVLIDAIYRLTVSDFTITHKGGIAEYRLMRLIQEPLTFEMYQAIEDLCEHPGEAGVIVMRPRRKAFASGTDISNFKNFNQPRCD